MAINPGEEAKMQMFIWNNIFFSLGFDVKDHYKDLGGDAAAFVAPRNDLQGVKVIIHRLINIDGLSAAGQRVPFVNKRCFSLPDSGGHKEMSSILADQ
jgi:protein TIF31